MSDYHCHTQSHGIMRWKREREREERKCNSLLLGCQATSSLERSFPDLVRPRAWGRLAPGMPPILSFSPSPSSFITLTLSDHFLILSIFKDVEGRFRVAYELGLNDGFIHPGNPSLPLPLSPSDILSLSLSLTSFLFLSQAML